MSSKQNQNEFFLHLSCCCGNGHLRDFSASINPVAPALSVCCSDREKCGWEDPWPGVRRAGWVAAMTSPAVLLGGNHQAPVDLTAPSIKGGSQTKCFLRLLPVQIVCFHRAEMSGPPPRKTASTPKGWAVQRATCRFDAPTYALGRSLAEIWDKVCDLLAYFSFSLVNYSGSELIIIALVQHFKWVNWIRWGQFN